MFEELIKMLNEMEFIMPGKITKQYNVCKTPNCKCKREKNPIKHGPYYYLSFTFNGKGRTLSIPEDMIEEISKRNNNYKKFKELINDIVELSIEKTREEILNVKSKSKKNNGWR